MTLGILAVTVGWAGRAVTPDERLPRVRLFSVDAESDGLYGPIWAIGAVVLLDSEDVAAEFVGQIDPATVTDQWVRDNIVPHLDLPRYNSRDALLNAFWGFWLEHKDDLLCVADFGAPVEAGLFRACIEMAPAERMWDGPYPMHELGTALLLAGLDPDLDRFEMAGVEGLTKHNPRDDALDRWHLLAARHHLTQDGCGRRG